MTSPVLIVGAGPTGLNLALRLARHETPFRIIDQADGPGTKSRALIVHARTLEFYSQLGLADRLMQAGTLVQALRMREGGEDVATAAFGEFGEGLSPYPIILGLPQDEHEALLAAELERVGARVEWKTALKSLDQSADGVDVVLDGSAGEEKASFAYVAGCDGARSAVRNALGVGFGGGTYNRVYYVADVQRKELPAPEFVIALERGNFCLRLPSRKGKNERLIGFVPAGREEDATFDDVRAEAERLVGITVEGVNWFSTYRVHHRVADYFRQGRCFLLGDAGHVHSPVGGQGMNTGIGDAVNLSWKLAQVLDGRAPDSLLDTYEVERIAFARTLVATTDRAFQVIADEGWVGRVAREWVMPHVFPAVTGADAGRHALFRFISQIRIAYPQSALSEGRAGHVAGGDRLPWVAEANNFAPLGSMTWQVHAFGEIDAAFDAAAGALGLPVHRFAWSKAVEHAGFTDGAAYLLRPDGYVALAQHHPNAEALRAFAEQRGLRFA